MTKLYGFGEEKKNHTQTLIFELKTSQTTQVTKITSKLLGVLIIEVMSSLSFSENSRSKFYYSTD